MYDASSLAEQLRTVPHFQGMRTADLTTIVAAGQVRRFPVGSLIFGEGEASAGMFVLMNGRVQLYKLGPQGHESIISVVEPIIMFNEVSALDGGVNLATARATQDCTTWNVSHESFHALLERYPLIGLGLLRVLALRYRVLVAQYEDLSFRSVLSRTAKLLLDLSHNGARTIDRHAHSNQELAARIATVPEALSRSLKAFKDEGHIVSTRAHIQVRDPAMLARLAQLETTLFRG
ncbi:MAG: Crp/Fnr family transcriptional regulator [Chloroflexi bacterium]|nr:Crp/Fnr family transcriptional regulator [Chloroflexota bacterium]